MSTNYVQRVLNRLDRELPNQDAELLRLYALLVFVLGNDTGLEDVHDAWSIWCNATRPDHPSIVPFDDLSTEIQELDRAFRDVIAQVAASA